jgi:hypothetical protein
MNSQIPPADQLCWLADAKNEDELLDVPGEDMTSKFEAFKAEVLARFTIIDAKHEDLLSKFDAFRAEIYARLAIMDAKYEAKFTAIESRLDRLESKMLGLQRAVGFMIALHVVQIGILAKLLFQ